MYRKSRAISAISFLLMTVILTSCSAPNISAFSFLKNDVDETLYYGTVEADQIDISGEIAGKISELNIEEGQKIKAGDLIAKINSSEQSIKSEQQEIQIKNAENELKKLEEGSRKEEIKAQIAVVKQYEAMLNQAEANINTANVDIKIKQDNYNNTYTLNQSGAATKNDLDNAKYSLDKANYYLESCKAQLEGYKSQLQSAKEKLSLLENGNTQSTKNTAKIGIERASKEYELSKLFLDKTNIIAPSDGIIESVNYKLGEYAAPGSSIATMLDSDNLWVKIYVPEKMLPNVKIGQEIAMTCDFLKDKKIKGKISYISEEAEFTPVNVVTKQDRMKLVFEVKIKILDNLEAIKPGMLVDVDL